MGRVDFVSIADRLNGHPDREVAAAALRARTAVLAEQGAAPRAPRPTRARRSRSTALVALMARGWIDEADADARLAKAMHTKSWQTAAELARAIRAVAPRQGNASADRRALRRAAHRDRRPRPDVPMTAVRAGRPGGAAARPGARQPRRRTAGRPRAARGRPGHGGPPEPALPSVARAHAQSPRAARGGARGADDDPRRPRRARSSAVGRSRCRETSAAIFPARSASSSRPRRRACSSRHLQNAYDGVVRFKVIRALVKLRREQSWPRARSDAAHARGGADARSRRAAAALGRGARRG